jgi:hypothetical protein
MCCFARAILSTDQGPTRPPTPYDPYAAPLIIVCRVCDQVRRRNPEPQAISPLLACKECSALYERHARNEPPPFLVRITQMKGAHVA